MTGPVQTPGGGAAGRPPAPSFDHVAERYARFNELRDRLLPAIAGWLRESAPGGSRAVDLGCGDGLHAARLADRYRQVLAVDISGELLAIARTRHHWPNLTYQQRGILEITPDGDGVFEAVVSVNSLHHVGPLDAVFGHVRRLLAPGGRLAVTDIVDPGGWDDREWHIEQAFAGARGFYDLAGGDPDVAADVLRLLLHPRWLDLSTTDLPPTREQFRRHAGAAFPGAVFTDDLHPVMCGFAWKAPDR